ncbi:hypothetical protein [Streptomyces chartreusis]|uniref:hypothetical protein n=1 Tax=Streptomyces chartreusis TaxID=1969 RepID=UPI00363124A1
MLPLARRTSPRGTLARAVSVIRTRRKSRFAGTCWTGQMYRRFENLKPHHVAVRPDLSDWRLEIGADVPEAIQDASTQPFAAVLVEVAV